MSDGGYDDGGYDDGGYDDGGYGDDDGYEDGGEDYGEEYEDEDDYEDSEEYEDEHDPKLLGKKIKRDINVEKQSLNEEGDEDDEGEEDEDDEEEEDEGEEDDEEGAEEDDEDSYKFNRETGDIGEEIVYKDLKGLKGREKIDWMNKDGESFKPYDFCFKKGNKTYYVDAKATIFEKGEDPDPTITENEQEFIDNLKTNERYIIARVYNARSENPTIKYFDAQTLKKVDLKNDS